MLRTRLAAALLACACVAPVSAAQWSLTNVIETPATLRDASPAPPGGDQVNLNRFGFYSDLQYNPNDGFWYALSDRGPGGGVIDYATRLQRIRIPYDIRRGTIGQPIVDKTILLTGGDGQPLNGLNPQLLNGDAGKLGNSFDPEGLALGRHGRFYISDEYGPSVYEFSANGRLLRTFQTPDNLVPRTASGQIDYVADRATVVRGRQDNRGFEGLALNASGTKLYAILQDPLTEEGPKSEGRRGRYLRIVQFDVSCGRPTAQYLYPLESVASLNAIDPSTADDFDDKQQGRSIGVSSIRALNDHEFLVLERDNRGYGIEETAAPVHKRVYRISLRGATDVSKISLAGRGDLPQGVRPVGKTSELDLLAALRDAGQRYVPEKIEGLAIGPRLARGRYLALLGTDNDYSVTQTGDGEQFQVCLNRDTGERVTVGLDAQCPTGLSLIPGTLFGFSVKFDR